MASNAKIHDKKRKDDGNWFKSHYIMWGFLMMLAGSLVGSMNWVMGQDENVKIYSDHHDNGILKLIENNKSEIKTYSDLRDNAIIKLVENNEGKITTGLSKLETKIEKQQYLIIGEIIKSRNSIRMTK